MNKNIVRKSLCRSLLYLYFENAYFKENNVNKEVELFINELFDEVINTSDFSLVDRSHEDKVWQNAYSIGRNIEMPEDEIVKEYSTTKDNKNIYDSDYYIFNSLCFIYYI